MCGIIGVLSHTNVTDTIIQGLKRLEYRGYDSSGIALLNDNLNIERRRTEGKLINLLNSLSNDPLDSTIGIGHIRWATHGAATVDNAHPHISEQVAIVHNGIIENYALLKAALEKEGHVFESETDTEVLAHFIETIQEKDNLPLEEAVRVALTRVRGAYAIVVIDRDDPEKIVAAR